MRIYRTLIAGLILTLNPFKLQAADPALTADTVYREALLQETTSRDLPKAVELYQKVLQQPDATRTIQSNAYLRLGVCYDTLGKKEEAKGAWTHVVQDYADQPLAFQEAKAHLQTLAAETGKTVVIQSSTPTVVYSPPPTRWALEWLDFSYFHTLDNKNEFIESVYEGDSATLPHSLRFYLKPWLAVGVEGRRLFSSGEYYESSQQIADPDPFSHMSFLNIYRSVAYIAPTARIEKRLRFGLTPFLNLGPAAYRFHFSGELGDSTKWSPGITSEAGLTLGWPRGFTLSLGYSVLGFVQETPDIDLTGLSNAPWGNPGRITQAHGWRWVGGPSFKLGFRW